MDAHLKKILDGLPDKPPRSRLAPYREFIGELRRRGRTYRDIAEILAEKCQVQVTASGVHDFMRIRSGSGGRLAKSGTKPKPLPNARPSGSDNLVPAPASEETKRKIAALKARNVAERPDSAAFEYDPISRSALGNRSLSRDDHRPAPAANRFPAREGWRKPFVPGVTIRDLVKTTLRHRPDRLIIGEVRGPNAFDLLDALNTGHAGSISTIHANSPMMALSRLACLALRANVDIPYRALQAEIGDLFDVVVQFER